MIDERQRKAISLLVAGEHSKVDVARLSGVSRTTLYKWLNDGEFNKEMDKRLTEIKNQTQKELNSKLPKALDLYWDLATSDKTDCRTKQIALSYIIDRCLGKPVARTEMTDNRSDTNINTEDILDDITEIDDEIDNDKVISIAN